MEYISTKVIANKWGIDSSRVLRLAREGRIEGAVMCGNSWIYPADAKKPDDGRKKGSTNTENNNVPFRYPCYLNFSESDYHPPLSPEERKFRNGQIAFHACEFEKANEILIPLSQSAENRYVRIAALHLCCYLAMLDDELDCVDFYDQFRKELSEEFLYKKEMMLLLYTIDVDRSIYKSLLESFQFDLNYSYHPTATVESILASILIIENGEHSLISKIRFDFAEFLCQKLENEGHYYDAQRLHFILLLVFQLQQNDSKTIYHAKEGLKIAQEHNLYWYAAYYQCIYPRTIGIALHDFPTKFKEEIVTISTRIREGYRKLEQTLNEKTYLSILSEEELELAYLASQGYSNIQIAQKAHVSDKLISRRYTKIYKKLGIERKQELVELMNQMY